jgi:hypothetical protein
LLGHHPTVRTVPWRFGTVLLAGVIAAGCSVGPGGSGLSFDPASSRAATPDATVRAPTNGPSPTPIETTVVEPGDPIAALTGRPVAGLSGGTDAVLRIDADGFRLPDDESLFDVHEDRVLSARPGRDGGSATLFVRDLDGQVVREIDTGIHLPQTGIVRGDDVYFGGLDLGEDGKDLDEAMDRGAWLVRGDAPPEAILDPGQGLAVYTDILRSADGQTIGIWRCGEEACETILIRHDGDVVVVPVPGLIALTDEVALTIGRFSDVTAYAIDDGAELWRAETDGVYDERYATSDGSRIVLSSFEEPEGGGATDQLRVEVLHAGTGEVQRSVIVDTSERLLRIVPSLSTDRYVGLIDAVLPDPEDGPHAVRVIDLETGDMLDVGLRLGGLRPG